ncbi:MAG TPA: DUF1592 domain-containing protein [Bdellovibrionales bacterium]|nr:DUF1592 domain-containing protein [Bdellovibrionales bacterium]
MSPNVESSPLRLTVKISIVTMALAAGCAQKSQLRFSDSDSTSASSSSDEFFRCEIPDSAGSSGIQRLTKYEIVNTLTDIFGATVVADAKARIDALPGDNVTELFDSIERSVSATLIQAQFDLAKAIATAATATDGRISSFAGACFLTTTLTNSCIDNFISSTGLKIYRRPLRSDEITELRTFYIANASTRREGLNMVLSAMLIEPEFHYRLEGGGAEVEPGTLELTPYELASRLSYTLWGSLPDAALFARAADGSIATADGLKQEFDRMISSAKARSHIKYFYRQWLELNKSVSAGYSTEFLEGISTTGLITSMEKELEDFIEYVIWTKKGGVSDLLTSKASFVSNAALAQIYNSPQWTPGSVPVELPAGERSGLLTRARYLATGDDETHPFRRGSRVLSGFLCYRPPRPDSEGLPEGALDEPAFDALASTRHRFEAKTLGADCTSCHSKINPMAFTLEAYDALGRFRTTERIRDPSTHAVLNEVPVDAIATYVFGPAGPRTMNGPVELSHALSTTQVADACFVRQWYRFSRGKIDSGEDHCSLKPMFESLTAEGGSILKVIESSVLQPQFRLRRLAQ